MTHSGSLPWTTRRATRAGPSQHGRAPAQPDFPSAPCSAISGCVTRGQPLPSLSLCLLPAWEDCRHPTSGPLHVRVPSLDTLLRTAGSSGASAPLLALTPPRTLASCTSPKREAPSLPLGHHRVPKPLVRESASRRVWLSGRVAGLGAHPSWHCRWQQLWRPPPRPCRPLTGHSCPCCWQPGPGSGRPRGLWGFLVSAGPSSCPGQRLLGASRAAARCPLGRATGLRGFLRRP